MVVDGLQLSVRRGEFLTLLGPSGSGKTTVLMMLAGFETPTSGHIVMDGKLIENVPPQKRNVGMVFQNYALFPHMTVAENLAYPLTVRRIPKLEITRRVQSALAMVQLPDFAKRRPSQLSGGQQQRVALARALIFEPDVVLMDEPLGALDKNLREQMQYEIKRLHEDLGVTIVFVTHDQGEALTMSDRVAVFNRGRIQQISSPDELYERPANAFVARFIGENNRISGTVVECAGSRCSLKLSDGSVVSAAAVGSHHVGSRATLSLRPERVMIAPAPGQADVMLAARIAGVIYHGDHLRVRLAAPWAEQHLIVKLSNLGNAAPEVGSDVTVGWRVGDCLALLPETSGD
ncbi:MULTISPECIES: ABC transporter ATP-binding protein [unclassified Bradyrhizobium]|uniref:ABC transporter ATP-binding protein n=1 Tax=unclassified Bradyrhizobium TaxID=2631580 RepID=UPI001FFA1548|nr:MULTISPECIES: ABC transporter ATP-binding protein [unclassified Bradyrhizobium]MCK1710431.1 ABC transporter ATP-binding protein [Bradyrhizobium sp. 143]MCK1728271.1 ABC transporter ATP-binding protein [Bradyrhizobium sp. 142]